jgi:hypothetical protein
LWFTSVIRNHRFSRDGGAGARPVFDDELLAKVLRTRLADRSRDDFRRSAGAEADNHINRIAGISVGTGGGGITGAEAAAANKRNTPRR